MIYHCTAVTEPGGIDAALEILRSCPCEVVGDSIGQAAAHFADLLKWPAEYQIAVQIPGASSVYVLTCRYFRCHKVEALTGGPGAACISNGNTWAESEVPAPK